MSGEGRRIRVLIVDDSAVARDLLERGLSRDPELEIVGKASDAYSARDKLVFLKPDVMTLDVEMPKMDGIEFLRRLMPQYPIPTVVVSAVTTEGSRRAMEAMEAGAIEVVGKPAASSGAALRDMLDDLAEKIKAAAEADLSKLTAATAPRKAAPAGGRKAAAAPRPDESGRSSSRRLVAVGASTGGTTALRRIMEALPGNLPPIVVVQHMPPVFTRMFADSLNRISEASIFEAEDGLPLADGMVAVAPGDRHLVVEGRSGGTYVLRLDDGPKVSGHRPSVDVLFQSVGRAAGAEGVGVLLTGMGRDGAAGLLAMRRAGARCIAQDEASSVVWGMPREAWEAGAAEKLVSLDAAAEELLSILGRKKG